MNEVEERTNKIRDLVNHPWKREIVFSDKVKWDKVCASMDVLGDTQLAIDCYFDLPEFSGDQGGYLFLYGLLQSLYLQQDASNHLSEALFNQCIDWHNDYPELYEVRELRNDAVGHPTKRGNDKSFHYIARHSINKNHFTLASYFPKSQQSKYKDIIIPDLKIKHEKSICVLLDRVISQMEIDLDNHKRKFINMKLIDFIPNDIGYCIGKVYEGIHSNYPLAEMNFSRLTETYDTIKTEINKRYGTYKALSGVNDVINKIDYIISRIKTWISDKALYQNKDAEVFMDGFNDRFKELKEMLKEIDNEFSI